MSDLSLQEAIQIVQKGIGNITVEDTDILTDFTNDIEIIGTELLKEMSDEDLFGMLQLIQSMAGFSFLIRGGSAQNTVSLLSNDTFAQLSTLIIKLTIGIAAREELR